MITLLLGEASLLIVEFRFVELSWITQYVWKITFQPKDRKNRNNINAVGTPKSEIALWNHPQLSSSESSQYYISFFRISCPLSLD